MSIPVPDLTTLDPLEVQASLDYVAQRVAEYLPGVETRRGVTGDIVSNLNAVLHAAAAAAIQTYALDGSDLSKLIEDPAGFPTEAADRLFGNFRVSRRSGETAAGSIVLVFSRLVPVVIPKGAAFTANGLRFTADAATAARVSAETVSGANDRLLYADDAGTYSFSINVTAEDTGAAGRLRKGTRLLPVDLFPNFVKAYAEGDFDSGADEESNEEMAARFASGLAERTPSNRITLESMILAEPDFAGTKAVSIIGFGDPEQLRYHSLFPAAHGSRIDVYCQTDAAPSTATLQKTCTLVDASGEFGIWECSLGVDDLPGAYRITKVVPYAARSSPQTGYEILEASPGFSVPDEDGTPDVANASEAAFSPFQTLVARFLDTDTRIDSLTVGESTADYAVDVEGFPRLAELQAFLADRSRRPPASDVLVKAPVPCYLTLNCSIVVKAGQSAPDADAIRSDVVRYVNTRGFAGTLGASALAYVIGRRLTNDHALGAVDMAGEILTPAREKIFIRSDETLLVPDRPHIMVTPATTVFVLKPEDIEISFV